MLPLWEKDNHSTKYYSLCRRRVNPLPDNKILDWSKLKQIADKILKCIVENVVRIGEIACYKQFLLFSQSYVSLVRQNAALYGNGLNRTIMRKVSVNSLPNDKILDLTKLKAFADDKFNVA